MCWAARLPYVPPDPKGQLHKSLHGFWWLGEFWPKLFSYPVPVPGQAAPKWKRGITVNLGRARLIPNGVHIHQSVFDRMRDVPNYRPKNLPQQYVTEPENTCELAPRPVHRAADNRSAKAAPAQASERRQCAGVAGLCLPSAQR